MKDTSPDTRFQCERLRAELSLGACVQQQQLPTRYSPCQDCALGREHRRQLEPARPALSLVPLRADQCLVCDQPRSTRGLCEPHYQQVYRQERLVLPGSMCAACGMEPARGTGLCVACERRRAQAAIRRQVNLWGPGFVLDGTAYFVRRMRLWGTAHVLDATPDQIIVQAPCGVLVATTEPPERNLL